MTALQWIVKEAKSIKKKYPKRFSKWTEYVAQASAIYASKHKGVSPVGKKKAAPKKKVAKKRKVAGVKASKEVKKSLAKKGLKMPHGYATIKRKRKVGAVKKSATTMHKDTKSHNVNIRVMSGMQDHHLSQYKDVLKKIRENIEKRDHLKNYTLNHFANTPALKKATRTYIKTYNKVISELKTHARELKKHI